MRKFLALVMVCLLGVTVLALVGCGGGDTDTAKQYLKTADAAYAAMDKDVQALQTSLTSVLGGALSGNTASVTPETVQAAETQVNDVLVQTPKVTADYAKVDSLKGVEDYQAYADAMKKSVTALEGLLTEGKNLVTQLKPIAGDQAALTAWFQANSATFMGLQEASGEVTKAYEDAQQIKKDKNLTW
jgi:hypothetical protein